MDNSSNNYFLFISGILVGSSFIYLFNLYDATKLKNDIVRLEETNKNLLEQLMYMDSTPYQSKCKINDYFDNCDDNQNNNHNDNDNDNHNDNNEFIIKNDS
jgi:hypothetical protein